MPNSRAEKPFTNNSFTLICPGLSKVEYCWRKSPPTWLLTAGYSAWPFFFYGWCFLNKIFLDWLLILTTQLTTSKLSDNPDVTYIFTE